MVHSGELGHGQSLREEEERGNSLAGFGIFQNKAGTSRQSGARQVQGLRCDIRAQPYLLGLFHRE
eukprot:4511583-Lingulodinium_polyedra.AAC.1